MDPQNSRDRSPSERRSLALIFAAFGVFGITFGTWLVLLAELQSAFSLSPATLGGMLTTGLLASLIVMPLSGRAADRWGAGKIIAAAACFIGITLLGASFADGYRSLLLLFLLFYASTAVYDVGVNAAAIRFEQTSGRQVLTYFHAAFSGFAALSALIVGSLTASGVPFRLLYLGPALAAAVLGGVMWRVRLSQPLADALPPDAAKGRPAGLYRSPAVLPLAVVAALAFLSEGEMGNWAAIYLRSSLELPALVGASGFAVFHGAMLTGRLLGARVTAYLGRQATLHAAGGIVASGMLLALSTDRQVLTLLGFSLVGLALSVVAPTVYSLAGDAVPGRAGEVSSVLTTVGYGGYLIGPILVGGIAEVAGLRLALATIVLAGLGIAFLSGLARQNAPAHGAVAADAETSTS